MTPPRLSIRRSKRGSCDAHTRPICPRQWCWSPTGAPRSCSPTRWSIIEHGRVVAQGTHEELLATTPGYARLLRAYEEDALNGGAHDDSRASRRGRRGGNRRAHLDFASALRRAFIEAPTLRRGFDCHASAFDSGNGGSAGRADGGATDHRQRAADRNGPNLTAVVLKKVAWPRTPGFAPLW